METPAADQVLRHFLTVSAQGKQARTVARYRRIDTHLRQFLEIEGPRFLEPPQERLLALERDVDPDGAFCRLFYAEDMVFALPAFLREPWLVPEAGDRRTQISQVSRLVHWICSHGLIDRQWYSCALIETRLAVEQARQGHTTDPRLGAGGTGPGCGHVRSGAD
jgi:hypothetical protein